MIGGKTNKAEFVRSINMDIHHQYGHAEWTWTCSIEHEKGPGHEHGHEAWTWICCMDLDVQHGHGLGHAA